MRKLIILSSILLLAAASCQKHGTDLGTGTIYLSLENSPVVEVVTKASEVNTDDFRVYVNSAANSYSYFYREMAGGVVVTSGMYTVSAENISEAASLTGNSNWGQPRYWGQSEAKQVGGSAETAEFSLTCSMANAALKIIFDKTIADNFTDYKVVAYTDQNRCLEYNAANTSGETPAVGYFSPQNLTYVFTGTYKDYSKPTSEADYTLAELSVSGTKSLAKATQLNLTFKTVDQHGSLGLDITVNTDYENLYETVMVDPNASNEAE